MDSFPENLKRMVMINAFCHNKCVIVHHMFEMMQRVEEHLTNYGTPPIIAEDNSDSLVKQCSFRLCVKPNTPLSTTHKVKEVSVCIPMDAVQNRQQLTSKPSTIEIMLFDEENNGNGKTHPLMRGSDTIRFSTVAHVLLFLDKLAVDKRPPVTDQSQDFDDDDDLDDVDE